MASCFYPEMARPRGEGGPQRGYRYFGAREITPEERSKRAVNRPLENIREAAGCADDERLERLTKIARAKAQKRDLLQHPL